ncbi:DUF1365 domain-containing protein [Rhizobium daejeonense]|uniref:DUF1365 domain-containing protein n=1 Tax=Rhizobium daejeonense TaxID=240521 RepID=A0A6M1S9D2_9HYPH|nr:DUF1365 domain-containing protein [Rhizobium daejeonense]NGO65790.1 DUF1365 domain-containing protein [Rhizobium daejeonense]
MNPVSAIFSGHVIHHRRRPKVHRLNYSVFSLLIDLDEAETLSNSLKLFGYNRPAVFSFHDIDHGRQEKGGLRGWVEEEVRKAGISIEGIGISILCYPRIFGYVFNPLTVYFCHTEDGALRAILYEVCNTFHERHAYIIPVELNAGGTVRHECAKGMYVSPFVPMDCRYRFRIAPPDETVLIAIDEADHDGPLLFASFSGKRRPLTDLMLARMLLAYPLMTLKIMGAIHWEALLLWLKGVPVHRHRKADSSLASTIVTAGSAMKEKKA